jgi:D-xylose transport system permease protein
VGALYGVAGVLTTSRLGAATPSAGQFLEFDAIAGAVIGGTSLRGGVGSVAVAIARALLLTTIDNGMSLLHVSSFIQLVIKGLVLLAALSVDAYMVKRRRQGPDTTARRSPRQARASTRMARSSWGSPPAA